MSNEKILIPEILDDEDEKENKKEALVKSQKQSKELTVETSTRLSPWAFINRRQAKAIKAHREAIQEEKGLYDDLADHRRSLEKLKDVDILVAKDKAQTARELMEELQKLKELERESSFSETDNNIAKKRRDLEIAKLDKALRYVNQEEDKEKTYLEETEKKEKENYERDKIKTKYKNKRVLDGIENKDNLKKELEERIKAKKERAINEIGGGKSLSDFNSEELARFAQETERIEDEMYNILDRMD